MGFMLPLFTWVSHSFLRYLEVSNNMHALIVAAGWGKMVDEALAVNNTVNVSVNDLAGEHLNYIKSSIKVTDEKRLHYYPGDILTCELPPRLYDAVLVRNLLHFFDGLQIGRLFTLLSRSLKVGGRIYVVSCSPYINLLYATKALDIIDKKKRLSLDWPGYIPHFKKMAAPHYPQIANQLPNQLHVLYVDELKKQLEKSGFSVRRIEYHPAPNANDSTYQANKKMVVFDGREYVCAEAELQWCH